MGRVSSPGRIGGGAIDAAAFELGGQLDELAEGIAGRISFELPDLTYDAGLIASCRANLELGFRMLRDGAPGEHAVPPHAARQYAQEVAHRVDDVGALLGAYRMGCGWFWREWSSAITGRLGDPAEAVAVLNASTAFVLGYHGALSTRIAQEFELERGQATAAAPATRADMARAVVAGSVVDVDAAERVLRYPLRRRHLGIAIQVDHQLGAEREPEAEAITLELRRAAGDHASLAISDDGIVSFWLGQHEPFEVESLVALGRRLAREAGVRIGFGEPGRGLQGFRRTHLEARDALRVIALRGSPSCGLVRYGNVPLEALLSADEERARRFVEQTLGGLAATSDSALRLRATLRIFFEEGLNAARTARRLSLHHNTIAYRIRSAEELLGRSIDQRRLELQVALALADALGERAPEP